ncbi:MAG: right-handed parallel beta-helix repeat-containing protein [Sandaracinaceae bacterium]|nr:right-handed parallel beta-helix repeat-containing protein [Sandaracinaceae bacterium]
MQFAHRTQRSPVVRSVLCASLLAACTGRIEGGVSLRMDGAIGIDAGSIALDGDVLRPDDGVARDAGPAIDLGSIRPDAGPVLPGGNISPVAYGDTFYTLVNAAVSITDVRANDNDADGDALTVIAHTLPAHGTLTEMGAGAFSYAPSAGFFGADSFDYTLDDGDGGSDTATVNLHVARTIYYVKSSGNDASAGTSPVSAWQTLEKVGAMTRSFMPGDAVLLERGSVFRGKATLLNSGVADQPFVIGAYGTGNAPLVAGSKLVTGWTLHSGNVWRANFAGDVRHVYVAGDRQTLARHPNAGWLRTDARTTTSIADSELTQPAGYFAGATVRLHSVNFAFERRVVAASSPGSISWTDPMVFDYRDPDWAYILDNKLSLLDVAGEWFHDSSAGVLYLYAPAGADPNGLTVEAATLDAGIAVQGSHTIVDGIDFKHQTQASAYLTYMQNFDTVRRCHFADVNMGIMSWSYDTTAFENVIERTWESGAYLGFDRSRVERNIIRDAAMIPGFAENWFGAMGMKVTGNDSVVRHNEVHRAGNDGIFLGESRIAIEENYITEACSVVNDCGGIYADTLIDSAIRHNIITDTISNMTTTSAVQQTYYRIAFGIYFGQDDMHGLTVEQNTSARGSAGIWLDHTPLTHGNVIRFNTLFDNANEQLGFNDYSNARGSTPPDHCIPVRDDTIVDNLLFSTSSTQIPMSMIEVYCTTPINWGTFERNRYYTVTGTTIVQREQFRAPSGRFFEYTLPEWQAFSGKDATSSTFPSSLWTPGAGELPELYTNPSRGPRRIALPGPRIDLEGTTYMESVTLAPYDSIVLLP